MSNKLHEEVAKTIIKNFEESSNFDAKLPSQHQLMNEHFVSRTTIVKALDYLEEKGYIYSVKGKGTFFKDIRYPLYLQGIYSYDCALFERNIQLENFVVSVEKVKASSEIAEGLNVSINEYVYKIIRVKKVNDEPIMVQINYLLVERFPEVNKEELQNKRLYVYLHENYNLHITHAKEKIITVNPPEKIYNLLGKSRNNSCLQVTRISYEEDLVIEYTHTYIATDLIEFNIILDMENGNRLYENKQVIQPNQKN